MKNEYYTPEEIEEQAKKYRRYESLYELRRTERTLLPIVLIGIIIFLFIMLFLANRDLQKKADNDTKVIEWHNVQQLKDADYER